MNKIIIKSLSLQTNNAELTELLLQLTKNVTQIDVNFLMKEKDCYCCEARCNGKLVGFGVLSIRLVPTKGFVGMFEDIVVDEEYRNHGIGTAIINHLIQKAHTPKLVRIDLTSAPHRIQAHQIYTRLGFEKVNTNLFRKIL